MNLLLRSFVAAHLLVGAAAVQAQRQDGFAELLQRGRRVNSLPLQRADVQQTAHAAGPAASAMLRADVDALSGTPAWLLYNTTMMPALRTEQVRAYLQTWVDANTALLGVAYEDLKPAPRFYQEVSPTVVVYAFNRFHQGVAVRDAYVEFSFQKTADGRLRLREITNKSFGAINLENPGAATVHLDELVAAIGMPATPLAAAQPLVYAQTDAGVRRFFLATAFTVKTTTSGEVYTVTMANGAAANTPLEAYSHKVFGTVLQPQVYKRTYLDGQFADGVLPVTTVNIGAQALTTDKDGFLDTELPTTAQIVLQSPRVRIFNQGSGQPFSLQATLANDATTNLALSGDNLLAFNAYTSIHNINKFVRRYLKPSEATLLNRNIAVTINVAGSCNAFYDGSISLFRAGGGCANIALVNDVIYHEWGHGLDDVTGRAGGITDGAFSEGIGDIVAAYYSGSSNMGPGFTLNQSQGIRQLKNGKRFPQDQGEVHDEGQIIGGAFWDLRQALVERHGPVKGAYLADLYFFRHLLTTDAYTESYQAVLRLDDDDGNPATRSPNACLILRAFKAHGLATDADCSDAVAAAALPVDASLYVGVQEEKAEGVVLMAAADGAFALRGCLGTRAQCTATPKTDVEFAYAGTNASGRVFFLATTPITFADHMLLTVFVDNQAGETVGARTLKVVSK